MAEGQKARVDENVCTGCGICVDACPQQAIEMADGIARVNFDKCDGDAACVEACPVEAIRIQ